jgi:hypothetical protein
MRKVNTKKVNTNVLKEESNTDLKAESKTKNKQGCFCFFRCFGFQEESKDDSIEFKNRSSQNIDTKPENPLKL